MKNTFDTNEKNGLIKERKYECRKKKKICISRRKIVYKS